MRVRVTLSAAATCAALLLTGCGPTGPNATSEASIPSSVTCANLTEQLSALGDDLNRAVQRAVTDPSQLVPSLEQAAQRLSALANNASDPALVERIDKVRSSIEQLLSTLSQNGAPTNLDEVTNWMSDLTAATTAIGTAITEITSYCESGA